MVDIFNSVILIYIIGGLVAWIIFALVCAYVAGAKGKDRITWGIIGLFLGFLALIVLAIIPSENK